MEGTSEGSHTTAARNQNLIEINRHTRLGSVMESTLDLVRCFERMQGRGAACLLLPAGLFGWR